ncbi:MAG: tetratricopeptide repeat protein, partial [Prevotellaceae bacterium]|nr:tetratricopeptide repeat protein [Prevotellaceae bacterium]
SSIGYYYRDVEGHQDADKAFKYLCIGAAFGDPEAMNDIGYALKNGKGIEKNDKWSFKFYEKAAEAGDAVGMSNVAQCYAEGRGIERNTQLALKWYEDAKANNCNEEAIKETARVLREQGILVNDNVEE